MVLSCICGKEVLGAYIYIYIYRDFRVPVAFVEQLEHVSYLNEYFDSS